MPAHEAAAGLHAAVAVTLVRTAGLHAGAVKVPSPCVPSPHAVAAHTVQRPVAAAAAAAASSTGVTDAPPQQQQNGQQQADKGQFDW
jgi:hypothetical protein